jgi:TRAP-type mannitol/chloroaromatic compound transport system permease large subunit
MEWMPLFLFVAVILVLLAGFPVAFTLGGTALAFAAIASREPCSCECLAGRNTRPKR